jgi:hypothetical protein
MKKVGKGLIFFLCCAASAVYAQGPKQDAPRVRLGDLDTSKVTVEELLLNTRLIAADRSWEVTRFTMTFRLPDGKTYGPFQTQGAMLDEAEIRTIKRLKKTKVEITIDEINVIHNGKEKYTLPVVLRLNN